jgi:N-acetylglucosamine-6-sulfatase
MVKRPNIVFVLTDDQDLHMDSLSYMPLLKKHVVDHGTSFSNHYCTVALCCPSRVSLWTGKAAHNTNVTDINPPWGGYPKFISQGFNDNYLPVWLQDAGYSTYYVGKLFNAQSLSTYNKPHAAGWTGSEFLLDPYTYEYLNATLQRNHDAPVSYEGQYVTDVVAKKSFDFLDDALESGKPFFLTIAPTSPHSNVHFNQDLSSGNKTFTKGTNTQSQPVPAERHKHLFRDVQVPRTPNFNPETTSGASWIAQLPKQNQTNVDYNDEWYRNRLRSLQAVDEMIDELFDRLEVAGILEETYVFYSTDNGYSVGQHRRQPGKQCAFEEDINVPLIVRGPGVASGVTTNLVTSHIDLAPTFLELVGVDKGKYEIYELDGAAVPIHSLDIQHAYDAWPQEHINVEMWGIIMSEGKHGMVLYPNHTYKALRVIGDGYSLLYTVWCNNEHELYDLTKDPYEMDNLYKLPSTTFFNVGDDEDQGPRSTLEHLITRLDSLLMILKTCKGRQCTHPWESIHPQGVVHSLKRALDPSYNAFYSAQTRVHFDKCERGYLSESEGPMWNASRAYSMEHEVWEDL